MNNFLLLKNISWPSTILKDFSFIRRCGHFFFENSLKINSKCPHLETFMLEKIRKISSKKLFHNHENLTLKIRLEKFCEYRGRKESNILPYHVRAC